MNLTPSSPCRLRERPQGRPPWYRGGDGTRAALQPRYVTGVSVRLPPYQGRYIQVPQLEHLEYRRLGVSERFSHSYFIFMI